MRCIHEQSSQNQSNPIDIGFRKIRSFDDNDCHCSGNKLYLHTVYRLSHLHHRNKSKR